MTFANTAPVFAESSETSKTQWVFLSAHKFMAESNATTIEEQSFVPKVMVDENKTSTRVSQGTFLYRDLAVGSSPHSVPIPVVQNSGVIFNFSDTWAVMPRLNTLSNAGVSQRLGNPVVQMMSDPQNILTVAAAVFTGMRSLTENERRRLRKFYGGSYKRR
jgi:hypothetical protein